MRERAKGLIGRGAKEVLICTFHALGVRMMRQDGAVLGLKPQFSILDSDDVTSILKDCGGTTDAATARQWQWAISLWKNSGPERRAGRGAGEGRQRAHHGAHHGALRGALSAYQSVDFDDLIGLPLKLLAEFPEVRAKWQAALGHVLVDEYQDTNATQYEVLKHLVGERGRFTAVGDDDQSIYGWRGATLDNLKRLPQDFPQLKVVKLEQNYRSTSAILRAANNVIGPNPKLYPKTLFSELGEGEPVRVVDADNEEHEAERVVARIQSLRETSQHKEWRDFAVLYRANHMAKPFEKALRRANVPYKVSGGQSFFDRAEIKDLCAWFRLWVNNNDDPAFLRAITSPKRGIGHQTLQSLGEFAGKYRLSLFAALFSHSLPAALPARAVGSLHEFGRFVNDQEYRARHTHGAEAARAFLTDWLKDIGYEKHLYEGEENEKVAAARWTNVIEFCDWMGARCGGEIDDAAGVSIASEKKSLLEVAQTISLLSTLDEREQDPNMLTLSTLHASKGLEWPHVMLVGVNEGLLPFKLGEDEDASAGRRPDERGHPAAPAGRAAPDVRGHHPRAAHAGGELDQAPQEGPRGRARAAQPLHRRDGAGCGHRARGPAREAARAARRIREEGAGHGRRCRRWSSRMKRLAGLSNAIVLVAICVHPALGNAQNSSETVPVACPQASEVTALHLYGAWQARWEGVREAATLTLGRSEDHPDGLRGTIRRPAGQSPAQALVAGDVDNGAFTLEESTDGRAISATWSGSFADQACGKEIRGTWTDTATRIERAFVLRKQPGWQ
jgi:ATP-dependent DNA helicase Rep